VSEDVSGERPEPTVRQLFSEQLAGRMSRANGVGAHIASAHAPSLLATVGGWRGLLESVLPVTVFSAVYGVSRDLRLSLVCAFVPAVIMSVWRLVVREPLTQAIGGLFGIGIGAFIATRTGRAEDFFLPSILKNVGFAALYVVSIAVRWPLIGVLLGFFLGEGLAWRDVPQRRRVYTQASWLWAGMFGLRAAVQTPLWLAGMTAVLGAVNVALGLPLFFLTIWLTYVVVRRVPTVVPPAQEELDPVPAEPQRAPDSQQPST
jgi:hypothetical protein